jgi:hypothetical protein
MPFKPAKSEALRNFVVLDSEAVLSGLSALDGGAVDEILTRTTEDSTKELGGQIGGRAAKAQAAKNKGRKVQEELTRRRTEHSAAAALIDRLTELEAIGEVDGALDEDVAGALTPGDTIRVRGELLLHPLHQLDAMLRSFITAAPSFGEQDTAKELRKVLPMWEAMIGSGKTARVLFDLATDTPQVPRVIVPVKKAALQDDPSEIPGFSTVLAKVDRIVGPDDQVLAMRVLQNAPVSELERSAVENAAVELVDGFSQMGVPFTSDDLVMQGPIVMLRPICIWR